LGPNTSRTTRPSRRILRVEGVLQVLEREREVEDGDIVRARGSSCLAGEASQQRPTAEQHAAADHGLAQKVRATVAGELRDALENGAVAVQLGKRQLI
jgi:hypothetical protein